MAYKTAGNRIARGRTVAVCSAKAITEDDNDTTLRVIEVADANAVRVTMTVAALGGTNSPAITLSVDGSPTGDDSEATEWTDEMEPTVVPETGVGESNGTWHYAVMCPWRYARIRVHVTGTDPTGTLTVTAQVA